ncbi:hypothetical protein [Arthrobacter sp. SW1]|uniref:hypothetical protein n=1 Tax=Arthrobacter sp. SW1 TaxID=1920889 RepID=UPI00111321CA|nr:hypothetical protein [Arthrobacter sp. SW1]
MPQTPSAARCAGVPRRSALRRLLAVLVCAVLLSFGAVPAAAPVQAAAYGAPRFTDPMALYDAATARVALTAANGSVSYSVASAEGGLLRQGTATVSSGAGSIDLRTLGPGYFKLTVRNTAGSASTDLGIVARLATTPTTKSPFGTTAHPGIHWQLNHAAASRALGLSTTRVDWRWERMATFISGFYRWDTVGEAEIKRLRALGIRPSLVIAYHGLCDGALTPSSTTCINEYAKFARATAQRFGTTVDYAVYNEWNAATNTGSCGRSADCYMKLLKPAAAAIRAAAPGARVLGPALGAVDDWWAVDGPAYTWFQRFVQLGGAGHVDLVTIHNYSVTTAPDGKGERAVRNAKALLAAAGISKPVVMEEAGYPTVADGLPEYLQAAFMARDAAAVLTAGAATYMPYGLVDNYNDRAHAESNFGLFRHEAVNGGRLVPKQAAVTQAVLSRLLAGAVSRGEEKLGTGTRSMMWRMADGRTLRIVWTTDKTRTLEIGGSTGVAATDWLGRPVPTLLTGGKRQMVIGGIPAFVTTPAGTTARVF